MYYSAIVRLLLSDCCETATVSLLLSDCYYQSAIVRLLLSNCCETAIVGLLLSDWYFQTATVSLLLSDCYCQNAVRLLLSDCYCQTPVRLLLSECYCHTATVRLPLSVEWKKLTAECFDLSECCDHLQSCWFHGTESFRSRSFSVQPVNKFPSFYGTWTIIALFTTAPHLSAPRAKSIQSTAILHL